MPFDGKLAFIDNKTFMTSRLFKAQ